MNKNNAFRWGILSTARIAGTAFIPAVREAGGGSVEAVASRSESRAKEFANDQGVARAYGSYEELIDDPDIDGIYIGLPNSMHAEWILKTAKAGKHVFCEKPMTLTVEEAESSVEACRAAGVLLFEAFVFRLHRQSMKIRDLIDAGEIGEVRHAEARFLMGHVPPSDNIRMIPELGGGALMDVGSYVLNWTRFIMGEAPVAVAAHSELHPSGVDRTTTAVLRFSGGRTANISCSFGVHGGQGARASGTKGVIEATQPFHPRPKGARLTLQKERETEDVSMSIPEYPFTDAISLFQNVARGEAEFPFDTGKDIMDQSRTVGAVRIAAAEKRWFDLANETIP